MRSTYWVPAAAALLIAGSAAGDASPAEAQGVARRAVASSGVRVRSEAVARGRLVVVIDLDSNRLLFTKGSRVLWSAPVGTGTGLRLETDRDAWNFHTPNGTFHVGYKAREPDWIAPDWYFLEHNLPIPPENSPKRRFPRGLGAAAVYLGHGLAIHGTDKPELLGQRVSHGCIRLANADALRLFHNVQVGTEIVMVGGRNAAPAAPPRQTASSSTRRTGANGERIPPPRDPFIVEMEEQETYDLLDRLDDELFAAVAARGAQTRWHQVASVLLLRGTKQGDDEALAGLLERFPDLGTGALREEYATFVTDAFAQGALRTLAVMANLDRPTREVVARAIVDGSLALFPGDVNTAAAPWPTRRAPREVLRRASQRSWDALASAEQAYRERNGLAVR
jgi:lipoprotein-anchoring transpeptidase ErfK/SrfK